MGTGKLSFQGTTYNVNQITGYHLQFFQSMFDDAGNLKYNLDDHSQCLEMIWEYLCPGLPKKLIKITQSKKYLWTGDLNQFVELIFALSNAYAEYFDPAGTVSGEAKQALKEAENQLSQIEKEAVAESNRTDRADKINKLKSDLESLEMSTSSAREADEDMLLSIKAKIAELESIA